MTVVANDGAGAVGGEAVPGNHDPSGGGDVEVVSADRAGHDRLAAGQLGWDGVPVPAVGHQRLPGHRPGSAIMIGSAVAGTGRSGSAAAIVTTLAFPSPVGRILVSAEGGEPVAVGLGLLDGQVVGEGPPPALRGGVVGLLHHPLAVPDRGAQMAIDTL